MQAIDYSILGGLALVLAGIVVHLIKRKKAGRGGCGCAGCPSAGSCRLTDKQEEENDEAV